MSKASEKREEKERCLTEIKRILETTKKRDMYRNGTKEKVPVLYTILRHVSKSGMSRSIDIVSISEDGDHYSLTYYAKCIMDYPFDQKNGGIKIGGCGMDMGFALIDSLSYAVYGDGYKIAQEWL